jgi:ribosomal-protein-alanine N-acetyltransferase
MLDTPSNASASTIVVGRLAAPDIVAMAQCIAIDVNAFPYPSSHFVFRPAVSPVWIARSAGESRVLGFLAASERRKLDLYLEGLATAVAARRRGVGRALLRAAIHFAREMPAHTLSLHVWVGNVAAIGLYRSEAFNVSLRVPRFYRHGTFASSDAYRMVHVVA